MLTPDHKRNLPAANQIVCVLAVLYTLYFAQSLILPILFSGLITLLLSPIVTRLEEIRIPRALSSLALLLAFLLPLIFLTTQLADPAERWIKFLPKLSTEISKTVNDLGDNFENEPVNLLEIEKVNDLNTLEDNLFTQTNPAVIEDEDSVVEQKIKKGSFDLVVAFVTAAPLVVAQILGSGILVLFLLVFGPSLFTIFMNDFPIVNNKKKVTLIVRNLQSKLSKYILTISIINLGLGTSTWMFLSLLGVEDALLWGAIVGLLNFAPYIGPASCLAILLIVGIVQFKFTISAFFPAGVYLFLNIIESQVITPAVLGHSMKVNPLVIIVWLFMLGWLWGVLGVLIALPLLVCIKLGLHKLEIFPHWIKLIEAK